MPLDRSRALVARSLLLFGFWMLLLQPDSLAPADVGVDWLVGALASVGAGLLSLRLLPPVRRRPHPGPLLRYLLRFWVQSLLGGLDVARRALDPRLPVDPGLLRQPTALPGGISRALFGAVTSQVPGTLAVGAGEPRHLLYHCLDQGQDVTRALATDEALFRRIIDARDPPERQPPP